MSEQAKAIFDEVCQLFDKKEWHYNKHEEDLIIDFRVSGEDIPMNFIMIVDDKRQLIKLWSPLPFNMSENKLMEGAIAACVASYGLADGSFDYDIKDGSINFRMTASYMNSKIGEELIWYMVNCAASTVDIYNDRFLALNKGLISINEFIEKS